jgi:hypothetical protein
MTDTERLDWLEQFVQREGSLLIHTGENPHHLCGLGISPYAERDLRKAIDGCQPAVTTTLLPEEVGEALSAAWKKYRETFGEELHGTPKQMAAMWIFTNLIAKRGGELR